ncbi:unnamed protein product [Kuraishia capsulata CBS 1993]|uniref:Uncharacterized protein n=1 Tax=Kuraishia capsulata CBS 1993 TaxID=1382522 RepID=W6MVR6_9ASCO|nr:uncharacterized protein KUCA_T00002412001 [Kuraishia capsulata CBS 1993]CDK26440.1 unnamed protein product [Kuraishia capsulata CBS 1993]
MVISGLSGKNRMLDIDKIGLLITDWDDTVTDGDTMELCFNAVSQSKPGSLYDHSYFLKLYLQARNEFLAQISSKPYSKRATFSEELAFQEDVKRSEESSAAEAVRLKFFKGVSESDFRKQADKIILREGFLECLAKVREHGIPVEIVSVNWTGKMIDETLRRNGYTGDCIQISSNEFEFDADGVCTGDLYRGNPLTKDGLRTGADKLKITETLIEEHHKVSKKEVVYIGDSSTDVLSMIKADRAIIIKGGSAISVLEALGHEVTDGDADRTPSRFSAVSDWKNLL